MNQNKSLEKFSDEDLRAELQRRINALGETPSQLAGENINDLGDLAAGAWNQQAVETATKNSSLAADWKGIAQLALARIREMLAIPLDHADPNYGASLRGINSAVSTGLTFITKLNEEILRPPKQDKLPELIAIIKEEETKLWALRLPDLLQRLVDISDQQLDELLARRSEHLRGRKPDLLESLVKLTDRQLHELLAKRSKHLREREKRPRSDVGRPLDNG
jgi:hypothetical protein